MHLKLLKRIIDESNGFIKLFAKLKNIFEDCIDDHEQTSSDIEIPFKMDSSL